jgi:hypothetical protein
MFDEDTMLECLGELYDNGFHIMPLYGVTNGKCACGYDDCENQYKHPRQHNWTNLPKPEWPEVEAHVAAGIYKQSYGVVLKDDQLVVDFDPRNNENALTQLNSALGFDIEDECMFVVETGSGGRHFYFKKDPEVKIVKNIKSIKGIDFLSKGSFVVGAGSYHKSGESYSFPLAAKSKAEDISEAPKELINLIKTKVTERKILTEEPRAELSELSSALNAIPNVDEDYDFWLSIGMALHYETGGSDDGLNLWYKWSDKSQKHDGRMMERRWASFDTSLDSPYTGGTIFKHAMDNGWHHEESTMTIDMSFLEQYINKTNKGEKYVVHKAGRQDESLELSSIPDFMKDLPGFIGEVASFNLLTAHYPLFMPAVNSGIVLASLFVGRDFTTDYSNYSGTYTMTIADTGAGKEHSTKVINNIADKVKMSHLIKGEVTGKSAIVTELYEDPRALFIKDEVAHWLQVASNKNASENKVLEVKSWMELITKQDSYFASDSFTNLREILSGNENEAARTHLKIKRPSASILAMTTPQKLSEVMNRNLITDGFLNRWIVFFAQEAPQKMNKKAKRADEIPAEILAWIESIERRVSRHAGGKSRNVSDQPINPIVLNFSSGANDSLDEYEDKILVRRSELRRSGLDAMINRNREKAMKLALVVELAKDPFAEIISKESTEFAIKLIDFTFEEMIKYLEFQVVENHIDKRYRDALIMIESYGEDGVARSELMKQKPFSSSDNKGRTDILDYLTKQVEEVYILEEGEGKGRKKHRYIAKKYLKGLTN